jgi:hypothetical protein
VPTSSRTPDLVFKALSGACAQSGVIEFDYSVEMWGVLWLPAYVYVSGNALDLEIDRDDLNVLVGMGLLEETKVHSELPNEPLEIARSTYRLLMCPCDKSWPRWVDRKKAHRCL